MCNKRRNEEIFNECAYSALMDKTNILKGVVGRAPSDIIFAL